MTVLWKKFPHVPDVTAICFTLPGYQRVLLTPRAPHHATAPSSAHQLWLPPLPPVHARKMRGWSAFLTVSLSLRVADCPSCSPVFHRLEKKTARTACFHREAFPLMELFFMIGLEGRRNTSTYCFLPFPCSWVLQVLQINHLFFVCN